MLKLGVEGKVRPGTKILPLVKLLQEPGSATIVSLQLQATSWLPHYADAQIMPTNVGKPFCVAGIAAMESA